ncbi:MULTISPECIES: VOC family protein [Amycolatopsis]|uniref:VOC family protein n=1 Tax=Amycolatopsis TaxID=1813 RepID=UPI003651AB82
MDVSKIATVVPVADLAGAVTTWTRLLGAEPTFVDGDRWAQFDVAGARVALAGTDSVTSHPALLLRVADVTAARAEAAAAGLKTGEVEDGPHELRCLVWTDEGAEVVLHSGKAG